MFILFSILIDCFYLSTDCSPLTDYCCKICIPPSMWMSHSILILGPLLSTFMLLLYCRSLLIMLAITSMGIYATAPTVPLYLNCTHIDDYLRYSGYSIPRNDTSLSTLWFLSNVVSNERVPSWTWRVSKGRGCGDVNLRARWRLWS